VTAARGLQIFILGFWARVETGRCTRLKQSLSKQQFGASHLRAVATSPQRLCTRTSFFNRTPGPPSSMNSIPADSNAPRMLLDVSSRPPNVPSKDSSRAIVGSDMPEWRAKSAYDQASRALAALT
jgi:hypothetical protein